MIFTPTSLAGVILIELEKKHDERGFFARSYCNQEFAQQGIHDEFVQCNISYNQHKYTLRGLHYQTLDHPESKLIRVVHGAVYDVVLDLRPQSPTFKQWAAFDLSADNGCSLYVPAGIAHGFLTLEQDTEVHYMMGGVFAPEASRGVRFDDPAFSIVWPATPQIISDRDNTYPNMIV